MDIYIIIIGISSGVALLLGIKNWSRNKHLYEHFNRLKLDKNILNEDVEKQINALKEDVRKLKTTKEPENPSVNNGEIPEPVTHILRYFKIAEAWYGQGRIIQVNFTNGIHQETTYVYDHDEVYENVIARYGQLDCWVNDQYFSNSSNIPNDIIEFVDEY